MITSRASNDILYLLSVYIVLAYPQLLRSEESLNDYDVNSKDLRTAHGLVDSIKHAQDYDELDIRLERLRNQNKVIHSYAITYLLEQLDSEKELEDFKPDSKSQYAFNYRGLDFSSKLYAEIRDKRLPQCFITYQDIRTLSGRSAWALERLLYVYLYPLDKEMKPEQFNMGVAEIRREVVFTMLTRSNPVINVAALPIDQKLTFADSSRTHPRLLAELARDPDVAVRRKVAENKQLPDFFVQVLRKDTDSLVRENAHQNNFHVRDALAETKRDALYGKKMLSVLEEMKRNK
jgi:hypothetical protein